MAKMNQAMNDFFKYDASILPRLRSTFDRSHSKTTTFDSSYLVPILVDPILPGDEVKLSVDALVRMATPIHPTMDSAYLDIFAFYCPYRIVWDNAKAFYGENTDAEYNDLNEYQIPNFTYNSTQNQGWPYWTPNSLLDYMEYPYLGSAAVSSRPVSILPFRMYQKIWNDWFRASEIQGSININYGDNVTAQELNQVLDKRHVGKLHDRFTSLLPSPQAGPSVTLPLGSIAPVYTGTSHDVSGTPLYFNLLASTGSPSVVDNFQLFTPQASSDVSITNNPSGSDRVLTPNNLYTDLSGATAATINDLRIAITTQQALEQIQRGGLRYNSIIFSMFGVASPDDVLQRPVLLGSHRQAIGMRTVAQTADTANGTVGQLGAFSATRVGDGYLCNQSFTEPGYLMVLCCVRPIHTYSQGYPDHAKKLSRFDHYFPVFNNIGNQPVMVDTLVAYNDSTGEATDPNRVLGYQSAWSEYRVKENRVTGLMRPDVPNSLGRSWTYADDYTTLPVLNDAFIREDPTLIDRTIAVPSEPQFIGDFYFKMIHTRPMGVDSVPGLMRL